MFFRRNFRASGWCEDGYKIVLEKSVHPYDCPEYTEEMKKRLRGINLENDLYIRMGKDKKYVMTQIITDMILEQKEVEEGKNVCVISDADAKRLFGTDDVVGIRGRPAS